MPAVSTLNTPLFAGVHRVALPRVPLQEGAADAVTFGAKTKPTEAQAEAIHLFAERLKEVPLSYPERLKAFFSRENLRLGWKTARKVYQSIAEKEDPKTGKKTGKRDEILLMALDSLFTVMCLGVTLPLYMIWPWFNMSKSQQAFFQGVHFSAKLQKLEAQEARQDKQTVSES